MIVDHTSHARDEQESVLGHNPEDLVLHFHCYFGRSNMNFFRAVLRITIIGNIP